MHKVVVSPPRKKRMQESDGDEFFVLCVCVCSKKALNLKIENTESEGARGAENRSCKCGHLGWIVLYLNAETYSYYLYFKF